MGRGPRQSGKSHRPTILKIMPPSSIWVWRKKRWAITPRPSCTSTARCGSATANPIRRLRLAVSPGWATPNKSPCRCSGTESRRRNRRKQLHEQSWPLVTRCSPVIRPTPRQGSPFMHRPTHRSRPSRLIPGCRSLQVMSPCQYNGRRQRSRSTRRRNTPNRQRSRSTRRRNTPNRQRSRSTRRRLMFRRQHINPRMPSPPMHDRPSSTRYTSRRRNSSRASSNRHWRSARPCYGSCPLFSTDAALL